MIWDRYNDFLVREELCSLPDGFGPEGFDLDDLNKILKFIIIFVDPLSPLVENKDFGDRSIRALKFLKFKSRTGFLLK